MKYTVEKLKNRTENTMNTYIGFSDSKNNPETERMLSNFYPTSFVADTIIGKVTFTSSEQYFMYKKAIIFNDCAVALEILKFKLKAIDSNRLGRKVRGFDEIMWDNRKYPIMMESLRLKFSQNEVLKRTLLSTGNSVLVETDTSDSIWGINSEKTYKNEDCLNIDMWRGQNLLGFALMELRDELNKEVYQNKAIA